MNPTNPRSVFNYPFSQSFYRLGPQFYSETAATPLQQTYWIHYNDTLSEWLGIDNNNETNKMLLDILSGKQAIEQSSPKGIEKQPSLAMVYAGHQFGGYSPQLGDGRALLIAQIETPSGTVDLQLKGAGKTPYSRFGDGRAVLRSSIREYIAGEAMHHLGIPSTRALSLIGSKEPVLREEIETGAIVARVARSHIRFGHFEYFHYTNQHEQLKQLADYVIQHFLSEAVHANDKYEQLLQFTVAQTAKMIAQWQSVGFAHGVMNTDNMSIIGETLDYGPYGFLDDYDPRFICNHSDHTGRYAFEEQPSIGLWNLNALAHSLSSLIDTKAIQTILKNYESILVETYATLMRKKLGLTIEKQGDQSLCSSLLGIMAQEKVDYTLLFRGLCDYKVDDDNHHLETLFSKTPSSSKKWKTWSERYTQRLVLEESSDEERHTAMRRVNPKFIARNYLLQNAINKAQNHQDHSEIETLFTLLQSPFDEHSGYEDYAKAPPTWGKHLSISCSS